MKQIHDASGRSALRAAPLAAALACGVLASLLAAATSGAQQVPIERAHIAGAPGHRDVREIRVVAPGAGRLAWLQRAGRIVFDRPSPDGFYDIYLAHPDGLVDRCITCDNFTFYKQHVLDPVVHPGGEYLVVQVQVAAKRLKQDIIEMALPLRGVHSELWAVSMDGKVAWRLTSLAESGGAVLGAVFSHEGDRLLWPERLRTHGNRLLGSWATRVATWSVHRGTPRIGKARLVEAGAAGFDLAQGFSPDDSAILVSRLPAGVGEDGLDLVRIDLASRNAVPLTHTPGLRDDVGRYSPDSRFIVWASEQGIEPLAPEARRLPWRSDLWIMDADGSGAQRLTFWNDPQSDHSLGQALITDLAWSPDGDRLLATVVSAGIEIEQAIWEVVLDPSYRRQP